MTPAAYYQVWNDNHTSVAQERRESYARAPNSDPEFGSFPSNLFFTSLDISTKQYKHNLNINTLSLRDKFSEVKSIEGCHDPSSSNDVPLKTHFSSNYLW